jgi:hypothetical protein
MTKLSDTQRVIVSSATQHDAPLAKPGDQQASIRACVAAQGWTMVAEYSDIASGKDDRRSA